MLGEMIKNGTDKVLSFMQLFLHTIFLVKILLVIRTLILQHA